MEPILEKIGYNEKVIQDEYVFPKYPKAVTMFENIGP